MILSDHAKIRGIQRAITKEEMIILAGIGMEVLQKGGTAIVTVAKDEVDKWVKVLQEVQAVMCSALPTKASKNEWKRKLRAVKRLMAHLQSEHLPYFVVTQDDDVVVTCGHCDSRVKRNY